MLSHISWIVLCSNCGTDSRDEDNFCRRCGNKLTKKEVSSQEKSQNTSKSMFDSIIDGTYKKDEQSVEENLRNNQNTSHTFLTELANHRKTLDFDQTPNKIKHRLSLETVIYYIFGDRDLKFANSGPREATRIENLGVNLIKKLIENPDMGPGHPSINLLQDSNYIRYKKMFMSYAASIPNPRKNAFQSILTPTGMINVGDIIKHYFIASTVFAEQFIIDPEMGFRYYQAYFISDTSEVDYRSKFEIVRDMAEKHEKMGL